MSDPETRKSADTTILFGGSCACGRITYTSMSLPANSWICHCVTCRKLSGAQYQNFLEVKAKGIIFYDQKENLRYEGLPQNDIGGIVFLKFSKIAHRAFCVDCKSSLAMRYLQEYEEAIIYPTLGTVDEATVKDDKVRQALKPSVHIFASQAPSWDDHCIGKDGLPMYQRFGELLDVALKAWEENKAM